MAFRRRFGPKPEQPSWKRRQIEEQEAAARNAHDDKVASIMGLDDPADIEAAEAMKNCICPRLNCPVHP